jgi:uncharacterized protein with ParB-like and HNH nuclease domain
MADQPPIPVSEVALGSIHGRSYVIPGIQRGFQWSTDQVRRLFGSPIWSHPIGFSLLAKIACDGV